MHRPNLGVSALLLSLILLSGMLVFAQDQDDESGNPDGVAEPTSVTIAGTVQSLLGCSGDWQPECEATFLEYDPAADIWYARFELPAGSYLYKAALNGAWDDNYGLGGEYYGPDIPLELEEDRTVAFVYDHNTGMITDDVNTADLEVPSDEIVQPDMVNIPGTLQQFIGCDANWEPGCEASQLTLDPVSQIWTGSFELPVGQYEYKVAINGGWGENYGPNADQDGPNIALNLSEDATVTFYYDHATNWIADDVRHPILIASASFQDELGCETDFDLSCLATWLQDPDGDGSYVFTSSDVPAGDYAVNVVDIRTGGHVSDANTALTVAEDGQRVNVTYVAESNQFVALAGGSAISASNLRNAFAHFVTRDTIAWDVELAEGQEARLLSSADGSLSADLFGLTGAFDSIALSVNEDGLSADVLAKFPHLEGMTAFTLPEEVNVADVLKTQMAVAVFNAADSAVELTSLQIPGVVDDLYTTDAPLGVTFDGDQVPTISVWAPTARNVDLLLYEGPSSEAGQTRHEMALDPETGVWSLTGEADWYGQYYTFEVDVWAPAAGEYVLNEVTDPYSVSLSTNSLRSQIIDLNDPATMPEGWLDFSKPDRIDAPEDITVYELHVRDFSAFDESVPEDLRGTYSAFTLEDADGVQHLRQLAEAGLTHLHLLPTFDIATINENKRRWFEPDPEELAEFGPASPEQQAALDPVRDLDGFNWGYDPYHFNVPEGSYATDADGITRIVEYREMVMALNEMGLYVVQDVVYNHTNSAGQGTRSVLDKIVPGYYHRLEANGSVARSTCCPNTATEHNMMRRLMIDSILLHSTQYKIDGFRFDLMGHHMLTDMIEVRDAVDALTLEDDGVDGEMIYIYGEGWNFGEVANNARGVNATQVNAAGTGIGTFNDRLRDAVRGGNPFGDRLNQGLSNGLFTLPNGEVPDFNESLENLLHLADQTRIGLAGNLVNFTFVDRNGQEIDGTGVIYGGENTPTGYTLDPQENVIYVSKHDNETLYDNNAYKAPLDASMAERIRMQNLGLSFVAYAQGVPFFHAGSEMLRSKSMDRNSYNSGDWFNRLDFSYQTNNFGVGLPPAWDNESQWDLMRPRLEDPALVASTEDILSNVAAFQEMLQVRYSTPLFRLRTEQEVLERLQFHNTGPDQIPGVIVMSISDLTGEDLDPAHDMVVVVFNTSPEAVDFTAEAVAGMSFELHPVLAESADEVMREASYDAESATFSVPGLTTAVFVAPQG